MPKEGVERSHRPDMVKRELGLLGRAVRYKSNKLLRALADEEQPKFVLKTASQAQQIVCL